VTAATIVPGDTVRTGTGLVRIVSRVFTPVGATRPTYAIKPLTRTGRARRSYAEHVTLVRTAELRRFYYLLDLARRRDNTDGPDSVGGTLALEHAHLALTRARERGDDGPGELAAAARSYRLAIDTRKKA
jgi:hypothetical protein